MSISVVIPAYNRGHIIAQTLCSLLGQTVPADEIIVVDDGSTDDTATVSASFGSRVRVISQENRGPASARNAGFLASNGDFIHFFDSDDLAAPNKHEVQLSALELTGADIAYAPLLQGRFHTGSFQAINQVHQQLGLPSGDLIRAILTTWSIFPHAALFRRAIVEKSGGFPDDLFVGEDQYMFLRCLIVGAKIIHTPETIEFYRIGDAGKITEHHLWAKRKSKEWARFLLKARQLCLEYGVDPMTWFGYRHRIWEAQRDLIKIECSDKEVMNQLNKLVPTGISSIVSGISRRITNWKGGIEQRITGARADGTFRMGRITKKQISFLADLGYIYESPQSLPWISKSIKGD